MNHTNKVAVSGAIKHYDGKVKNYNIEQYNKLINDLCSKHNITYIENSYIGKSLLNGSNLHSNRDGDKALGNAFSTYLKSDEINCSMANKFIDLIAFNETRLDANITDNMINIDGYDVGKDRSRNGGGVCIYLRSPINYKVRNDLVPTELEVVGIEITKPHSKPFLVTTVYRPPSASSEFFDHFEKLIKAIDNENKEMFILGDVNCDMLKADSDSNIPTKKIKSLYELYQLTQLINEATRVTMTTTSLIDHIVNNTPEKICHSGVIHTGISDHSLVFAIRKISIIYKQENTLQIRNMKNFDKEKFTKELLKQPWEYVYFFAEDPNAMWEIWKNLFLEVLHKHAPLQHKKIRSNKVPWMTSDIKKLMNTRDNFKRKAILTNNENDWLIFKTTRNKVNIELRNVKKDYYSSKIADQKFNPKKAWKSINSLLGRQNKPTVINELRVRENNFTNNEDIAKGFNEYFSNIGPNLASNIDSSNYNFETHVKNAKSEFAAIQHVTVSHFSHLLHGLSSNKATGIDKISCKIIKLATPVISDSLTLIFNQAITLSSFPDEWKIARVIPLYKNGQRNIPVNYKPISVLLAISKIMEQILYD